MREAISKIRAGILFVLIDLRLGRWDLLPDFAGYLIFLKCLEYMEPEYPDIVRLRPFCQVMAGVAFAAWFIPFDIPLLSLFTTILEFYVIFVLLSTMAEYGMGLGGESGSRLKLYKNVLVIFQVFLFAFRSYMGNHVFIIWLASFLVLFLLIEMQLSYLLEETEKNVSEG